MKAKLFFVFLIIGLSGCSADQIAAMRSINDGFAQASALTAPPPSFYQSPPAAQPTPAYQPIKQSNPWAYPNQPIGTCTKDISSGTPKITCY